MIIGRQFMNKNKKLLHIKIIIMMSIVISIVTSCQLVGSTWAAFRGAYLYDFDIREGGDKNLYNLWNLISGSITEGVITNTSLNWLATSNPCYNCTIDEEKISLKGLFFQSMQCISQADEEIIRSLNNDKRIRPLPRKGILVWAPVSEKYVQELKVGDASNGSNLLTPIKPMQNLLNLGLELIKKLSKDEVSLQVKNIRQSELESVQGQELFREQLYLGVKKRLNDVLNEPVYSANPLSKLVASVKVAIESIIPLALYSKIDIPELKNNNSSVQAPKFHLQLYLSPPVIGKVKGFSRQIIPLGPIITKAATFYELSYLQDVATKRDDFHLIKMVVDKNFSNTSEAINMDINFGRLPVTTTYQTSTHNIEGDSNIQKDSSIITKSDMIDDVKDANIRVIRSEQASAILPIDISQYQDAFTLHGLLKLPIDENDDWAITKNFKQKFNRKFGDLEIDARIHRLNVKLIRPPKDKTRKDRRVISRNEKNLSALPLRLMVSMADSDLSYRVRKVGATLKEKKKLSFLGFHCLKSGDVISFNNALTINTTSSSTSSVSASAAASTSADDRYTCIQDFATWKQFKSNFLSRTLAVVDEDAENVSCFKGALSKCYKAVMSKFMRFVSRKILMSSLPRIEKDLDQHLSEEIERFLLYLPVYDLISTD